MGSICGRGKASAEPAGPAPPPAVRIRAAGENKKGQCGIPPPRRGAIILESVEAPGLQPPQGTKIVKICCGSYFVIILTAQGDVLHAGSNDNGELGTGKPDGKPHPSLAKVALPSPAVDIAVGRCHAAAVLSNGEVWTWGSAEFGELGHGRNRAPAAAQCPAGVRRVYAGGLCTFFLTDGGDVAACGRNHCGQLGLGCASEKVDPPQIAAALCGRRIAQLQVGDKLALMLEQDGSVYVWGMLHDYRVDGDRYLADGSGPWTPEQGGVPTRLKVAPALCIATGYTRYAVVTAEGELLVWGGQEPAAVPKAIALPGGARATAVLFRQDIGTYARSADGEWTGDADMVTNFRGQGEMRPIHGLPPRSVPLCGDSYFVLYLEGPGAEEVLRRSTGMASRSAVMQVAGVELWESDLERPLSELGVSAESAVELLRIPPLAGPAAAGGKGATLTVYVNATTFGAADRLCLELHPEATARDLVAAAAQQLGV